MSLQRKDAKADRQLSTREFAQLCGVQPDTVRQSLWKNGSYFGVKPERRPNGRLAWPAPVIASNSHNRS